MFVLKKLIAPFLYPPGIFVSILLVSGILFLRKSRKAGVFCLAVAAALWGISTAPVSNALMKSLEAGLVIPPHPHGDVIILLGGGTYEGVQDLTGIGSPSEDTLARIVTVVRLQKRLGMPVIVSGGAAFSWSKPEAPIDRRFLLDLGVPADKIITEEKSRDTVENARYSKGICEKRGFKSPLLVTSAYHMRRALLSFRRVDLKVTPVPCEFKSGDRRYGWADYLPESLRDTGTACREYLGLLYYTFTDR